MRVAIPENLTGKALVNFLVANKKAIIAKKKSLPIWSDNLICDVETISKINKSGMPPSDDPDIFPVKVSANAAWWCDSYMDVLTDTSYDKTVKEQGTNLPHIADHIYVSTGHVGDVKKVYTQLVKLKDLGINKAGSTTCVIWETDIRESYDKKVFDMYKAGKMNQHSIGLYYKQIELAINDKDSEKEYDFWKKYIDKVINKELPETVGYFWLVNEIQLIENSCVLFGANKLTGTLADGNKSTIFQPDLSTEIQPLNKSINFGALI